MVASTNETTVAGDLFVPKTPEQFTYDLDGNLTSDGRWSYSWDAENRLVAMAANTSVGPQISLKFQYDWKGRRIRKQVWNNTTWNSTPTNDIAFAYDGWNLVSVLSSGLSPLLSFTWGSDLSGSPQGAGGVGGLLQMTYYGSATTNCFVAFDANGDVAVLVNAADGTTSARYEYGPFAEPIRAVGPVARVSPLRFSTKYQDEETDLLYYGHRYLQNGRWLGRDPISEPGFGSLNRKKTSPLAGGSADYVFVLNAPLSKIDFAGLTYTNNGCAPDQVFLINQGIHFYCDRLINGCPIGACLKNLAPEIQDVFKNLCFNKTPFSITCGNLGDEACRSTNSCAGVRVNPRPGQPNFPLNIILCPGAFSPPCPPLGCLFVHEVMHWSMRTRAHPPEIYDIEDCLGCEHAQD